MNYKASDAIDREISNKEHSRAFIRYRSKARNPLAYCDNCGAPIFNVDSSGEPYRLCYSCSRSS